LFSIPVATFGGVDRGSEVEVVAGAPKLAKNLVQRRGLVFCCRNVMAEYVYIGAGMKVSLPPVFRKWIASVEAH
jgi:hypothetical protein